ncbi:aminodeoxychorismate lyase [Cutibacterium sp. WCA-380-WT-3A]|uniref:Aminodeoxychorismate lyase n=1 Tax=Cutibacterium porci TaxID=2605781 RepID=A0A7K0J3Q2_9ACTN|nr:aminodeoxychorismate lyase [Cutibacterium porci]MSS44562.1 aminodeoxychorismate lyase [Cutibacterium porci]
MNSSVPYLLAILGEGVVPPSTMVCHADDLGLVRGDGVFDTTRIVTAQDGTSRIDHLDEHLSRFARSIAGVDGPTPDLDSWHHLIDDAARTWRIPGEAALKLVYTNGRQVVPGPPRGFLIISPLSETAIEEREGIDVLCLSRGVTSEAFADAPWLLGGVKTLSYAVNVAALRYARSQGSDDVIFTSTDGYLLEGPTSGLIIEAADGLWTTPTGATGILSSITVSTVFDAADEEGFKTSTRLIKSAELLRAQGAWLLSSVRGVAPILSVDSHPLAQDEDMTRRLRTWAGFDACH